MLASRNYMLRACVGVVGPLILGTLLLADGNTPASSKVLALVGARVATQTDAGTTDAAILIRDGKIAAVGHDIAIPADATKVDVTGMVITPGLIDARSSLWLTPAASQDTSSDAGLEILDEVDPTQEDWREVARQGVTAVYVQPSHNSLLGGRGAVLRVGPAETVEDVVIKSSAAAQASLGAAPSAPVAVETPTGGGRRGGRGRGQQAAPTQAPAPASAGNSLTRYAQYEQLKRTLEAAKKYDDDWKKVEKADAGKKAAADKSAKDTNGGDEKAAVARSGSSGSRLKHDPAKDFLRKVVSGQIPLRIEAHREDDVANALRLAKETKVRLVLEGLTNPRSASEAIIEARVPLVLGPFADVEEVSIIKSDRPADWPKSLIAGDGLWAIGTFSNQPRGSRLLRVHAANAVALGLDPTRVLRAITRDAAEILGIADRTGTIEVGKDADLVAFAGDPLDPSVPVRLTISGGKVTYDATLAANASKGISVAKELGGFSKEGELSKTSLPFPTKLPKKYALKTTRLLTEAGSFKPAIVVIDNGRISAVEAVPPEGIPTYDLGAAVVAPGLVAAYNDLGMHSSVDDNAEAHAGQVRTADVFDPHARPLRELIEGGYTAALFTPGSVNVVAGAPCGVRLGANDPLLGDEGLCFVLAASAREASRGGDDALSGFGGRRGGGGRNAPRYPGSLGGQIQLIEQVLSGQAPSSELYVPPGVRQQMQTARENLVKPLLEQKGIAFFEAHDRAEIGAALHLIERFKLRAVLVNPVELASFLDDIKRLGVGIVASTAHSGSYDRSLQELVAASHAWVPVSFGCGSAQDMRTTAVLAINAGMSREVAWRGVTTTAAKLAGLPESFGRLVPGAAADIVIWDGSPLDLRSRPLRVLVDGKEAYAAH
jgi:imidazolonepropionase-like amidohydrolase